MIAIFIIVFDMVIQCLGSDCHQVASLPVKMMIEVGTLELIFELGAIRIYANKRVKDKIDKDK